jgi:hypothetical protein
MAKKDTRKTTGAGGRRGQFAKGGGGSPEPSRGEPTMGGQATSQTRATQASDTGGTATATMPITHTQIAERARQIWEQRGRPQGEDERNWREAERQLKRELGIE